MMWMKKTIKELDIYISDGNYSSKYPRSEEFVEEGIPFIRGNNMVDGDITDDEMYFITPEKHSILLKGHVKAGDVLITTRGNIGQVAIVPDRHEDSNINAQIVLLRTNQETLYNRYLLWALQSHEANEQYLALQTGTALKQLPVGKLEKLSIEVTDINKQHEIADILDKTYEVVKLRRKELQLLDDLIKARFVELFDGKYPEDTLLNLCSIIDYRGKTPEKVERGLPFITAKNVKMHHMTLEPREYISKETYDKVMVRGFPKEGDVVFTTEAPLGNVCRIPHFDTEFYIGQRIVTMQTDALNPTYLEYALSDEEFVRKYMGKSSGSTVTGIRVRLLEQLTIPVPPRTLQDEFSIFVEQVDKSKVAVQKALTETQLLFDSLMQQYFG